MAAGPPTNQNELNIFCKENKHICVQGFKETLEINKDKVREDIKKVKKIKEVTKKVKRIVGHDTPEVLKRVFELTGSTLDRNAFKTDTEMVSKLNLALKLRVGSWYAPEKSSSFRPIIPYKINPWFAGLKIATEGRKVGMSEHIFVIKSVNNICVAKKLKSASNGPQNQSLNYKKVGNTTQPYTCFYFWSHVKKGPFQAAGSGKTSRKPPGEVNSCMPG